MQALCCPHRLHLGCPPSHLCLFFLRRRKLDQSSVDSQRGAKHLPAAQTGLVHFLCNLSLQHFPVAGYPFPRKTSAPLVPVPLSNGHCLDEVSSIDRNLRGHTQSGCPSGRWSPVDLVGHGAQSSDFGGTVRLIVRQSLVVLGSDGRWCPWVAQKLFELFYCGVR